MVQHIDKWSAQTEFDLRNSQPTMTSRYVINSSARQGPVSHGLFDDRDYDRVKAFYSSAAEFESSPLVRLPGLASSLGVNNILVKDESARMGLSSFKVLGVSYAIGRLVAAQRLGAGSTVACASEGNHGLAVARV